MRHDAYTIVAPIRAGEVEALRRELRELGDAIQGESEAAAGNGQPTRLSLRGLHFLGCCILDARDPACLVLELSCDGGAHAFLPVLVAEKRNEIDRIFRACDGYPGPDAGSDEVVTFLLAGGRRSNAFYAGNPGRSEKQIAEERSLPERLAGALARTRDSAMPRRERWRQAVDEVRGAIPALEPAPLRPLRVRLGIANPQLRARLRGALRLLAAAAFWVVGLGAAALLAREPWHRLAVLWLPLLLGLLAALVVLRQAPRRIRGRALRHVEGLALRRFAASALWAASLGGLVVWAAETAPPRDLLAAAVVWGLDVALASALLLLVIAVAFTFAGGPGASLAGALGVGLLAWRFHRASTAQDLLGELCLAALAIAVPLLAFAGAYLLALRRRELREPVDDEQDDIDHVARVGRREGRQLQTHLASEVPIRDGRLRLWTLRAVLRWVDLRARFYFNRGHLAGIPSIHFARFLIVPERRSLVFLSNYDGLFDAYLGEFSDVVGVNAVWSNTVGFPRSFLLLFDGARAEDAFKRFARRTQVESLIWYSAYPELRVEDVDRATAVREQMWTPVDDAERGLLAELRRWWRPPLDEAALDAAIEGRSA